MQNPKTSQKSVQHKPTQSRKRKQPAPKTKKPSDLGEAVGKDEDAHRGEDAEAQHERELLRGVAEPGAAPRRGRQEEAEEEEEGHDYDSVGFGPLAQTVSTNLEDRGSARATSTNDCRKMSFASSWPTSPLLRMTLCAR